MGKEAGVTTKQTGSQESGKGPSEEEDGGGSETEHPCSDAQVVRFEVRNEGEHEDAINLDDLGSPVQSRLIIQLPESSPAPKIEIVDAPQNPTPSNFLQTQNPKGDKENVQETGKKEDVKEKDDKSECKEKKSLMKKLLGCFSCCVRPQKKQKQEMVT